MTHAIIDFVGSRPDRRRRTVENTMSFGDILEAADNLSVEDQESLLDILQRRLAGHRRRQVARDIEEAREALKAGKGRPAPPDEIFQEITS